MLEAMDLLTDNLADQCRIVGDGSEIIKIRAHSKLNDHIVFWGEIPYTQMAEKYKNADVLLMPSLHETTEAVILEDMCNSLPVVTINKFSGAELFDSTVGCIYNVRSRKDYVENLKNILVECITQPNEVIRKRENAHIKALEYTWNKKIKQYYDIYERLRKNNHR